MWGQNGFLFTTGSDDIMSPYTPVMVDITSTRQRNRGAFGISKGAPTSPNKVSKKSHKEQTRGHQSTVCSFVVTEHRPGPFL